MITSRGSNSRHGRKRLYRRLETSANPFGGVDDYPEQLWTQKKQSKDCTPQNSGRENSGLKNVHRGLASTSGTYVSRQQNDRESCPGDGKRLLFARATQYAPITIDPVVNVHVLKPLTLGKTRKKVAAVEPGTLYLYIYLFNPVTIWGNFHTETKNKLQK